MARTVAPCAVAHVHRALRSESCRRDIAGHAPSVQDPAVTLNPKPRTRRMSDWIWSRQPRTARSPRHFSKAIGTASWISCRTRLHSCRVSACGSRAVSPWLALCCLRQGGRQCTFSCAKAGAAERIADFLQWILALSQGAATHHLDASASLKMVLEPSTAPRPAAQDLQGALGRKVLQVQRLSDGVRFK